MQSRGPGPTALGYEEQRSPAHTGKEASGGHGGSGREKGASFIPKHLAWSPGAVSPLPCFSLRSLLQPFLCLVPHLTTLLPPASRLPWLLPAASSGDAARLPCGSPKLLQLLPPRL